VLAAHGLQMRRLAVETTLDVESYRFKDVRFAAASLKGA
jgi:hypothetical protein